MYFYYRNYYKRCIKWISFKSREAEMRVIFVCKEYFQTEDEKVYFFEPLEKEISVEDMQKIVDANEKLVKELKHECDSSN